MNLFVGARAVLLFSQKTFTCNVKQIQIHYTYILAQPEQPPKPPASMLWFVIHCSDWSSCAANAQTAGCTYQDIFTEALQYPRWSSLNDYNLIQPRFQQRYREYTDSVNHLCINISPGISLTETHFDDSYYLTLVSCILRLYVSGVVSGTTVRALVLGRFGQKN